ncbi:MAG: ABC transporter ATP-binding protein [Candidatus Eisenbacteria bacterium]|nr:ABC transporter ATP-binding protein [Candidatus Eisenbacteria bacterium]
MSVARRIGPASAVCFDRVSKSYRRGRRAIAALESLTLRLERGSTAALVGPNGSGKTTALMIAGMLVTPTSGTCSVLGRDVRCNHRQVLRDIGVSFGSERSFYLRLSARQNLEFFAGVAGMRRADAREAIGRVAAELDIERFLPKPARQLSRGALARLAVGRACLGEPALLILDEPFASVDDLGKELLWQALKRRVEAGRSVLLATHDLSVAERCDLVVQLAGG